MRFKVGYYAYRVDDFNDLKDERKVSWVSSDQKFFRMEGVSGYFKTAEYICTYENIQNNIESHIKNLLEQEEKENRIKFLYDSMDEKAKNFLTPDEYELYNDLRHSYYGPPFA